MVKVRKQAFRDWTIEQLESYRDGSGVLRIERAGRAPLIMAYGSDLSEDHVIDRAKDSIFDAEIRDRGSAVPAELREEYEVHTLQSRGRRQVEQLDARRADRADRAAQSGGE